MRRSQVEKQLYDATKHLYRPSDSDLEAIVGGESIPRTVPVRIDVVFPTDVDGDAFGL